MNLSGLVNMVLRRALGRLMNRGITSAVDLAAGQGKKPSEMTKAERQQARNARQMAKKARQAARLARRATRQG